MASATTAAASKTVRLFDPTTAVTKHAVRFPRTQGKQIQGKVRFPNSQAAKNFGQQESTRLKKALQHITHGKNIFAYSNFRTNQVVYSLSRSLDSQNVLSQLVYHGKKTVPAGLRKDMWVPYFSVHFPTPTLGLEAYKLLREFSRQRQFEPPAQLITNSKESLERKRPQGLDEAKKWERQMSCRIGQIMEKKDRAKVLMDQKATSVADTAAVLAIQAQRERQNRQQEEGEEEASTEDGNPKEKKLSHKARRRVIRAQKRQQAHEELVRKRIEELEKSMSTKGFQAKIDVEGELADYKVGEGEVKLLWTDLQDAQYARSWPSTVQHGELEPSREHIISPSLKLN
ncbi:hypothetical protein MGYG_07698 [Nannizzia gypsea CBS 118893]|uniref:Large ribosomal subunit protein mL67 n=1 Tax=Arthroderma gypseum (strain ATCC MYA-4604 / CBS 118893) TaxID=535722 RepID=E4V3W7_ARTGP|nr:hypothetical protein MGYG_07698 [Nannizzia gypsea CBS 118893]EFR04691.1 hypothetical protein MGYG_07698 [Nannizzia gypsea CBS 118893]